MNVRMAGLLLGIAKFYCRHGVHSTLFRVPFKKYIQHTEIFRKIGTPTILSFTCFEPVVFAHF